MTRLETAAKEVLETASYVHGSQGVTMAVPTRYIDALRDALDSPVEKARDKCVLMCRRAVEEYDRDGCIYTNRLPAITANAVSCGKALLASERDGRDGGPA